MNRLTPALSAELLELLNFKQENLIPKPVAPAKLSASSEAAEQKTCIISLDKTLEIWPPQRRNFTGSVGLLLNISGVLLASSSQSGSASSLKESAEFWFW